MTLGRPRKSHALNVPWSCMMNDTTLAALRALAAREEMGEGAMVRILINRAAAAVAKGART